MEGIALLQRLSLLTLSVACPVLLVLLLFGSGRGGEWAFATVAMLVPAALIALAGGRRVRWVAIVLAVLLAGGAALMLGLAGGERIAGLPGSAWAMFALLWAWPLIVTVWASAASFRGRGSGRRGPEEASGG